jgi:hypothetical protein
VLKSEELTPNPFSVLGAKLLLFAELPRRGLLGNWASKVSAYQKLELLYSDTTYKKRRAKEEYATARRGVA